MNSERGQAATEFGLILAPLLLIVTGVIYFGIALNYWLDMNRIASQGARYAVVNNYPGCSRTQPNTLSCGTAISLQRYLACQRLPNALKPTVTISFPDASGSPIVGNAVQVQLDSPFKVVPILGLGTINLRARAAMRLEQIPVRYQAGSYTPTSCP